MKKINKTEQEWHEILNKEQFNVLRKGATELAGSGEYYHYFEKGMYLCGACGHKLFESDSKYHSGSGWPSFDKPCSKLAIEERADNNHGMQRTEVLCSRCGSHLGHVFNDGPADTTGLRYCVNSKALKFVEKE